MSRLIPIVVAILVVFAGCSALSPQQSSNNTSPTQATTAPTTATEQTTTATKNTPLSTTTAGTTTSNSSPTSTSNISNSQNKTNETVNESHPSAAVITNQTLTALNSVTTYRANISKTVHISGNLNRTVTITSNGSFNRVTRTGHLTQTSSVLGRTITTESYFVNGTLYLKSQQFVRTFGSKWAKRTTPNGSAFALFDRLSRYGQIMSNSTMEFTGIETINGTPTYRLQTKLNQSLIERGANALNQQITFNVTNISVTYWINTETMLPVQTTLKMTGNMSIRGQSLAVKELFRIRYTDYGKPVSISLPPAAKTAVPLNKTVGMTTNGTATTSGTENESNTTTITPEAEK